MESLEVYLQDPLIEVDDNLIENAIRPIAVERKNWLHIGSERAGPRVAAIISIVETCRDSVSRFATTWAPFFRV